MKGLILAATFSWGCKRANELKITAPLKEFALSFGKKGSPEKIRKLLEKLFSYFYYRLIAKANEIGDPFDFEVVKAHWIGNELLEKVNLIILGELLKEMEDFYQKDKILLGFLAKPIVKYGSAHHNATVDYDPACSVIVKDSYFWHLGIKRIKATQEDLKNFAKYGKK